MRIGTATVAAGIVGGRMIGASIDAGPSPTISATLKPSPMTICSAVIEKRAATPAGRSKRGSANAIRIGTLQTSATRSAGSSGAVHMASSAGVPRASSDTGAWANFLESIAVRAASDGHIACASGASSLHCDA